MASVSTSSKAQLSRAGPRGIEERKGSREGMGEGKEKEGGEKKEEGRKQKGRQVDRQGGRQACSKAGKSPISLSTSLGLVPILHLNQYPCP